MSTIPLRCACGAVTGHVEHHAPVPRNVCHCAGCQGYARWLDREEVMLDAAGGTDLFQLTPSQLRIDGTEQLRCVRLTPKGAVRWYTACCRTPVANTLDAAWVPWLALHHRFVDAEAVGGDTRSAALGPVAYRIHCRNARQPVPDGHPTGPVGLVVNTLIGTLWDTARGRARPNPFFDGRELVAEIEHISEPDRQALGLGSG